MSNARNYSRRTSRTARSRSDSSDPVGVRTADGNRHSENDRAILWYSNAPWSATGYGQQTAQAIKRFKAEGHKVAVAANYGFEGGLTNWQGFPIYPKGVTPYSDDVTVAHYLQWASENKDLKPLLMTLFDVWVFKSPSFDSVPQIASWIPIDHTPAPPAVLNWCKKPNVTSIAMSKFGLEMMHRAGVDALYVPHGIESIYKPTADVHGVTGRQLMGVPEDAYVVMMNSANKGNSPPRKAFGENLLAFALFAKTHSDAYLYMHCEKVSPTGVNLPELAKAVGIPENRIVFADPYAVRNGIPLEVMPCLYSAADVLLAVSMGEGFGIPVIEAQACGTRAITSNQTAQPELNGHGWLVDCQPYWDNAQSSFFHTPYVRDIVAALEESYQARQAVHTASVKFASAYEADKVFEEYWKPAMAVLGE